uniref:ABC transporter transmembrane region n=1 Tax=Candidatus Kentrum sp. UNK TaxID=2126344 RepID=A0A451ATN7_9GAMM|nr:MAG: ABC transporter transmembrane region [Candidatus Kentron sp. UNK]VFK69375.1 MAG: ABC transporter transmembrane region [Candidatus Kentron sp. UNK]
MIPSSRHQWNDVSPFGDLNKDVRESISSLRLTKAFGREIVEIGKFNRIASETNEANARVAKADSKYHPVIELGVGFSFFLSVAGGAWLIYRGDMTLGQLTSFSLYLGYMIWPMFAVGLFLNLLERG